MPKAKAIATAVATPAEIAQKPYRVFGYGHDFGNGDTCSVTPGLLANDGSPMQQRIPSVYSNGSWAKITASAAGMGKSPEEVLNYGDYVLGYDTAEGRVEKYMGNAVYSTGSLPMSTNGDGSRYWVNNYSLEFLMVGSSASIQAEEYGLVVVTGLPISIYNDDPENVNRVKAALTGTYTFHVNNVQRTMHVEEVHVIMEGAGALIAYANGPDTITGGIDIGERTTDLFVAKGNRPQTNSNHGFPIGVSKAADLFCEKFRQVYHYRLALDTCMNLLKQFVNDIQLQTVYGQDGQDVDPDVLATMIDSSLREIGKDIATQVVATWDAAVHKMDRILIFGGGAYYFSDEVIARIGKAVSATRPEMRNADGYALLAEAKLKLRSA